MRRKISKNVIKLKCKSVDGQNSALYEVSRNWNSKPKRDDTYTKHKLKVKAKIIAHKLLKIRYFIHNTESRLVTSC